MKWECKLNEEYDDDSDPLSALGLGSMAFLKGQLGKCVVGERRENNGTHCIVFFSLCNISCYGESTTFDGIVGKER